MRATMRVTGAAFNTIASLQSSVGAAAAAYHDRTVRGLRPERVEADEIHTFTYARAENVRKAKSPPPEAGDTWTWTVIDPDTKLIITWAVGDRSIQTGLPLMEDLATRIAKRVQITTDGLKQYIDAVDLAFNRQVDFAQLVKVVAGEGDSVSRVIFGSPNPDHIGTSIVERQNRTMRTHMRRYTRKTDGHSKKIENHRNVLAIYFTWYNFVRVHESLGTTPAVAAGLASYPRSVEWLADLADESISLPAAYVTVGRNPTYSN